MTTAKKADTEAPILTFGTPDVETRLAAIARRADFLDQLEAGDDAPLAKVREILSRVRRDGDAALVEYTAQFDGVELAADALAVPTEALEAAWEGLAPEHRAALEAARANIVRYQEEIYDSGLKVLPGFGRQLELRLAPVDRAGIYVPGGRAAYPSTVLMTAIPAQVAGVPEIVVVTPPGEDGEVPAGVLAACHLAGVTTVYRVGGAQAIGALAYGTETIGAVDTIAGPGNQFVTLAKRLVYGQVGIDLLAGPTELVIIADETARADWVAADLLAQAEHDPMAACILLTTSADLAKQVAEQLKTQMTDLPTKEVCGQALADYGLIVVCEALDQACELANRIAPEHLSVVTRTPEAVGNAVTRAGATFLGPFTPEVVGDYIAGPSHVLPTGGTARFCSGLSVFSFLVRRPRIAYQREGLSNELSHIIGLARLEGLEAHARSAEIRLKDD